jgi:histidyl-tRNA synthetase
LSRLGIAGGGVYDALVALAAKEHGAPLANEVPTKAVGVPVIVVASRAEPIA